MNVRVIDLRCPNCKTVLADEVCPRDDTPLCPIGCGVKMDVYWGLGAQHRTPDAYTPITVGGKRYDTRAEFDSFKSTVEKRANREFQFESMTSRGKKNLVDDHMQDMIDTYKSEGRDWQSAVRVHEQQQERGAQRRK